MLRIRPTCENCNKLLSLDSEEAMICKFECTSCKDSVELLKQLYPNCGGGFERRPLRPAHHLEKYAVSKDVVSKPVNIKKHLQKLDMA